MTAEKYLREKERLSQALGSPEKLKGVTTAIVDTLTKYNLDGMPETAFDVMCFTLETIHLEKFDVKKLVQSEIDRTALADTLKEILLEQAEAASKSKGGAAMNDITTKELVDELSKREGIEKIIAEPYQDMEVKINGPTIVLIVRD